MRKNSPRKWLHACLDLLPVILIPVFMIYSHRHTIDSGSIQVRENKLVDFNQQFRYNENYNTTFSGITYTAIGDGQYNASGTSSSRSNIQIGNFNDFVLGHQYLVYGNTLNSSLQGSYMAIVQTNINSGYIRSYTFSDYYYLLVINDANVSNNVIELVGAQFSGLTIDVNFMPQITDLSQMYGLGNEPTAAQFFIDIGYDYNDYTLSHKVIIPDVLVTYDDTDIMSQFTYQLYNAVDKYFNMGNVFNLTGVYDWFNINIFNGQASISIYIVWNIVLYEFVMDLLFLLYGLFMWFIDMVQHLMDKPFKSIK